MPESEPVRQLVTYWRMERHQEPGTYQFETVSASSLVEARDRKRKSVVMRGRNRN